MMFQEQILRTEKLQIFMMVHSLQLTWQFKMLLEIALEVLPGLAYTMVVELVGVKSSTVALVC